ncbi:metallophosphoesterase [Clostridium sp.]|uniref:metallophosphoesterase n=1 Tax=Clostridium sp. TaxID=1506 RepID=UPI0039F5CB9D
MQNNYITVTNTEVTSKKIPDEFNNFKIAHLSDLHNKSFGKGQKKLVKRIKDINPDIVVITGDIIDSRRYNEKPSLELVKGLSGICEVYYVPGNHEIRTGKLEELEKKLRANGAVVLRNESKIIKKENGEILIAGVDDPSISPKNESDFIDYEISKAIENNEDKYKILLSHRPEKFPVYIKNNIDLTFTGHAHGGQIRLPFIGGVIAPHQGWFPKYTEGKHESGNSIMIISRGLGNSLAPVRIFNRPEIVVTTLKK